MTNTTYNNKDKKQKGFTLIELLISIVVGSVVISILIQQLAQTVQFRQVFELENRIANETYIVAETLKRNIFDLQTQEIEVTDDGSVSNTIVVEVRYLYDITSGAGNVIERDYLTTPIVETIVMDLNNEQITYEGEIMHSSQIRILDTSTMTVERINPASCASDPNQDICGQGILRLDLDVAIIGGEVLSIQKYSFTIII